MSAIAGITLEAFVDDTIFAAGYHHAKSCTTTMWFELSKGPNKSAVTSEQHFSGTLCGFSGSCVFLFVKIWQSLQCSTNCFFFSFRSRKKKWDRRRLSKPLLSRWLPPCASWMAWFWRLSGRMIRSSFGNIPFPVTVISGRICLKSSNSFFAVWGIQVCPLVTISRSSFKF